MNSILFDKQDLLTFDELRAYMTSIEPIERSNLIISKIINYYLNYAGQSFIFNKQNIVYDAVAGDSKDNEQTLISKYLTACRNNLDSEDRCELSTQFGTVYKNLAEMGRVKKDMVMISNIITVDKCKFKDPQILRIHFKNGYYDFGTGTFKQRVQHVDYINYYIPRNYTPSTEADRQYIMNIISQIYPNEDERNYLLMLFGIALTGKATNDQTILFLLGLGSSGKSTIMELMSFAFNDYVQKLDCKTFSASNQKIDKIMNTYAYKTFIRLSHINEIEEKRIDDSLFKKFCDGEIETTALYAEGQNSFKHYSKVVITANTMPNLKIDTGTSRRIESYEHTSLFVSDKDATDEAKHVYLIDKSLKDTIKSNEKYLNAICDILFLYGHNWYTNKKIYTQPNCFANTKQEILGANDVIGDFLDKFIKITKDTTDRIGKETLYRKFKEYYPKSVMTIQAFIPSMKAKNIEYNCGLRSTDNARGCFLGVKFIDDPITQMETELSAYIANEDLQNKVKAQEEKIKAQEERTAEQEIFIKEKDDIILKLMKEKDELLKIIAKERITIKTETAKEEQKKEEAEEKRPEQKQSEQGKVMTVKDKKAQLNFDGNKTATYIEDFDNVKEDVIQIAKSFFNNKVFTTPKDEKAKVIEPLEEIKETSEKELKKTIKPKKVVKTVRKPRKKKEEEAEEYIYDPVKGGYKTDANGFLIVKTPLTVEM